MSGSESSVAGIFSRSRIAVLLGWFPEMDAESPRKEGKRQGGYSTSLESALLLSLFLSFSVPLCGFTFDLSFSLQGNAEKTPAGRFNNYTDGCCWPCMLSLLRKTFIKKYFPLIPKKYVTVDPEKKLCYPILLYSTV